MFHDRRLAAILFTDIVGYTSMMQKDEFHALTIVRRHNSVVQENSKKHGGEVVNFYGDGCLAIFPSACEAVQSAVDIQKELRNEPVVQVRIGLHIGEIFFEDGKVIGDGVNVASRVQSLGQGNTILVSGEIMDKIKNRSEFKTVSLGLFEFKNVDRPMEIFALDCESLYVPKRDTIEGKLKPDSSKNKQKVQHKTRPTIIALIAFFLISVFAYYQFFRENGYTGIEKSIAVLPFENTGLDSNYEYLSDGIPRDIINKLSKISAIQTVTGWASVRIYKKTLKGIKEIAGELGVSSILTGTIQKHADNLHIIAELIDVKTGKRIWGDDFNSKMGDLFIIQSEVAQKISDALKSHITEEEKISIKKNYTENIEAYKHYTKGRFFMDKRNKENFDSAEANFNKALLIDPNYALAYVGLADCYTINQKGLTQMEAVPIAREYAKKALLLDSNLSEALTTMSFIQVVLDYNWKEAKKTLEKAMALNPNYPLAHIYYGNLLHFSGESTSRGLFETKKALRLEPLSSAVNWVLGRNYFLSGYYDSAYVQLKKTLILEPNSISARGVMAMTFLAEKKPAEALDFIKQLPLNGNNPQQEYQIFYLNNAYALLGDSARARVELEKLIIDKTTINKHCLIAQGHVFLGEYAKAIKELEMAYADRELRLYFITVNPLFKPIRNMPGFIALKQKMNLQ